MSATSPARPSVVSQALARDRLGVPSVIMFALTAAAPLMVVGALVSSAWGWVGVTGFPLAFVIIAIVLALFSFGYVAMSRHITNAGAFYTYVTHGLGRPLGVGAAWMALLAYNALQIGLYGIIGAASEPVLAKFDITVEWWVVALVTWVIVAISLALVLGLTHSPWGRALKGVREDEDAMRSLGKNVFAIKMQALIIGGLFGAIGGMMYVLPATVQPDALGRNITFFAYTALLLGGAATIWGPVLGTLIFFVGRIAIIAIANTYLSSSQYLDVMNGQQTSQFAFIVVGVALMLLVIFRPQGILGDKRELRFNV